MPTKSMKIHVQLPTFNQQNEEVKSLVNFFMEHSSMVFHGDYDQDNKLESYTGCIRFNNRVYDSTTDSVYDLFIPYHPFYSSESDFPTMPVLPVASVSGTTDYPFIGEYYLNESSVIRTDLPYLLQVKSAMGLYNGAETSESTAGVDINGDGDTDDSLITLQFQDTTPFVLPAVIIPKVGEEVNTNQKLKPKALATATTVPNPPIQSVPIEDIFDESGEPIAEGFVYDFQLRTLPIDLAISNANPSTMQVYYKIGLCILNPSESNNFDSIISDLMNEWFVLEHTDSEGTANTVYSLSSSNDPSTITDSTYKFDQTNVKLECPLGTGKTGLLSNAAIVKLNRTVGGDFIGLLYFKLYDATTNQPIQDSIEGFTLMSSDVQTDKLAVQITDQGLDLPVLESGGSNDNP